MPTTDGIFVLDASPPVEVEGVMVQRVSVMFVFAMDPHDIGGTDRAILTPAHLDGDDAKAWVLPISAELIMPTTAPQVVTALDAGEAIYQIIRIPMAYPIVMNDEIAALEVIWQALSADGQSDIATERFQNAGTWTEFIPTP